MKVVVAVVFAGWQKKEDETFARNTVAERLVVVERETGVAVSSRSVTATYTLVRPGRIVLTTVDVVTVARTLRHHRQTAHCVMLLHHHNNIQSRHLAI